MTEKPITAKDIEEAFGKVDFEKLIRDDLIKELKEQHNEQMNAVLLHPDAYQKLTEATDTSFFGKIKYGWRLFMLSVSDWKDAMVSEDYVEEFFWFLGRGVDL
jgi:hypothetical protein